jgi:hypothetical protein
MSCPEGAGFQCSGSAPLRIDNGVTLTSSGVQAYGGSTSDLRVPNPDSSSATGFTLLSGNGFADLRFLKDANRLPTRSYMILRDLGISWDKKVERPPIIEAFEPTQGRTALAANGAVQTDLTLPASSDLSYFNFATLNTGATQANYANNRYFPRPATNPVRCPAGQTCRPGETDGLLRLHVGDWRTGGTISDLFEAERMHEDGDIHAGNSTAQTPLPGASDTGVPYPGGKGFRALFGWTLEYANLGAWFTQDTVEIVEWLAASPNSSEHNQNRRGLVAFGQVTDPASVPTTGTATYSGRLQGWYVANTAGEPPLIRATVTVTVNFATREATVDIANAISETADASPVPLTLKGTVPIGAAGTNVANYMTGALSAGALRGGIGGRFFGPIVAGGTGAGPAEVGFAFRMTDAATGASVLAGFIGRKL